MSRPESPETLVLRGAAWGFWTLIVLGGLPLLGGVALLGSDTPELAAVLAGVGLMLLLPALTITRRVRIERDAVVIERLLTRSVIRYDAIQDIWAPTFQGESRGLEQQIYVELETGRKRSLGMLAGDVQQHATSLRAAWQRAKN